MNLLNALHQLLGQHQQSPQVRSQVRSQQQIRQAPFKMYEDGSFQGNPAQFRAANPGYRFYEDNTFSPPQQQLQVRPQHAPLNLGVPYGHQPQLGNPGRYPQPGQYNPGFTALQNSGFGAGGNPQIRAFNAPTPPTFNPQDNPNQQYWLQ